jgi:hypothetical protein
LQSPPEAITKFRDKVSWNKYSRDQGLLIDTKVESISSTISTIALLKYLGSITPTVIADTASMIGTTVQVACITVSASVTVETPATIFPLNCLEVPQSANILQQIVYRKNTA